MQGTVKSLATRLGFDECRIARAMAASHGPGFRQWLADGCHGDMAWLARNPERRCDPREVLPGCHSVICLALNYYPGSSPGGGDAAAAGYRIARYAWNDDYHDLMVNRLAEFDAALRACGGVQRCYVDTGPVLERDFASAAGLGWNGKSTMQIHRRLGTWLLLAEILTTLEVPPDAPLGDHCGTCTRCVSACPTRAITAPHHLDARRCLAYLTIEHQGPIPEEFRAAMGDRIYGCDECLEVCPWNRFAQESRELAFHARPAIFANRLRDFLALDDAGFRRLFARSPIQRIKRARFLRNVCVALGNTGTSDDLPALRRAAGEPDPLIAEHAAWAVARLEP
ncbi:MAG: tRNA epoxyqueuosine(34) reductase QueG [Verrucomicrobia bacterium]|nr:tRNA epoxyqueuosine(34) reductase QueG [Verrucomicrobiota bacterium]